MRSPKWAARCWAIYSCYKNPACYSGGTLVENPHIEEAIDFNWAFMRDVISVAEASGATVPRLYDLCPEYGGISYMATKPGWYNFTHDIWARYIAQLRPRGIDATISFNHADWHGTEKTLDMFDELGWPSRVAIDVTFIPTATSATSPRLWPATASARGQNSFKRRTSTIPRPRPTSRSLRAISASTCDT